MPSKSKKQHNFFEMIVHNPKKAKELGVPQSVGEEFVEADKAKGLLAPKKGKKK